MPYSRSPRRLRRVLVLLPLAGLALATAACDDIPWNTLEDGLREATTITEIVVSGDSGNVTVTGGDDTDGVDVRRKVRYADTQPTQTMSVSGSVLTLTTDCGPRCSASYEVFVDRGVKVRGSNDSGNVRVTGVSDVDMKVNSGNLTVTSATGTVTLEADSGNVEATDVTGPLRVTVGSGNVTATDVDGETTIETDSGNVTAVLPGTANLTARVGSGTVNVRVPNNCCRVNASSGSGNERVTVTESTSGTVVLDLRTDSGNINVTPR